MNIKKVIKKVAMVLNKFPIIKCYQKYYKKIYSIQITLKYKVLMGILILQDNNKNLVQMMKLKKNHLDQII